MGTMIYLIMLSAIIGISLMAIILYVIVISFIEAKGSFPLGHLSVHRSKDEQSQITYG